MSDVEKRFIVLENSLVSLAGQISKLAKKLDLFMPAVSQSSPGCQLPSLGEATSGETAMTLDSSVSSKIKRLKNMLEKLFALVLSLTTRFNDSILAGIWKIATCNVRGLNNSAKQDDVIYWHKEMNNLISIIINKFDDVQVFTSGLNSGHLGFGVVIILDNFLARHVCKNNLSVSILGLYVDALSVYASFKKCFDLGLVDSLRGSLFVKMPMWTNSHGVTKALDYILVSLCLVNAVIDGSVADVENYFNTDYKAVFAFMDLGGLLNIYLSSIHKQANKNCWKFDDATAANAVMFLDKFKLARKFSDLDAIWDIVCKVIIFSANGAFKKKWFKSYDEMFTKEFSKLHNLKILVSKIVKASCEANSNRISSAYGLFNILHGDNFFVLKSITTQSPIFGSVVEDALEKNYELWLVLQDICKAYDSVSWTSRIEDQGSLTLFLAASAFVDDTIWVSSSQAATQYILDTVSEFFRVNNISINNEKTVAISINQRVSNTSLSISDLLISIARRKESYWYLGIYLLSEGLSKPSLAKVHMDIRNLGSCKMKCGAAAYFSDLDLNIGAKVGELVFLTMVELQAIVLALECVLSNSSVVVYSDSQVALDACVAKSALVGKQFDVSWHKVKRHLDFIGNKCADKLTSLAVNSSLALPVLVKKRFIKTGEVAVSGNICYFAHEIFRSVNRACWEIGSGFNVIDNSLLVNLWLMLFLCTFDDVLYIIVGKGFVFRDWVQKASSILGDAKIMERFIVDFVRELGAAHCMNIWLVRAKYKALMKKGSLIPLDGSMYSVTHVIIGFSIAVLKKSAKKSGHIMNAKSVLSKKKNLAQITNLAKTENISINTNLKKSAECSDQIVIVKKIPIGILAEPVHTALYEFGQIKSINMQLIGLWQKTVVEFEQLNHANLVVAK
ncbi:hypothetical protein G9A89_015337 [Geosiphon pyriformis]|nr:hypothetical protein G9A89_015337 [Geosiphon pyriformis]